MAKSGAKRITFLSAIITLISFIYKIGLSVFTASLVLFIASLSTLMIFICKMMFVKNVNRVREKKKKAYLVMILSLLIYCAIFIGIIILRMNGIDLSNHKTYEGLYGTILILVMVLMFLMSVIGLKSSLEKTDLMVIGLKEMTFASAVCDLVIIEEFISRIILEYKAIGIMDNINNYFSLGVCAVLLFIILGMLKRFITYKG